MLKRVLFLTPNPPEAAGTRYRVLQYLPYLRSAGFASDVSPFLPSALFQCLYEPGQLFYKAGELSRAVCRRLNDVLSARRYDVIVVAREAMLLGPPIVEWLIARIGRRPIVLDLDDAVFVPYASPTYGWWTAVLKCPWKTSHLVKMSAHVLAGNEYLAEFARTYNRHVTVLPTVVDPDRFTNLRLDPPRDARPVIGWIGSHSTARYLDLVTPALRDLARDHKFVLRVIGAGRDVTVPGVDVENRSWRLAYELEDFASLDIGIYPLSDDPWTKGKCAFKAIQYMAAGVPCVCSSVGMTREVIQDGLNGFLVSTEAEWRSRLEALLNDAALRLRFKDHGKRTVLERYSLHVHAPRLAEVLKAVCS